MKKLIVAMVAIAITAAFAASQSSDASARHTSFAVLRADLDPLNGSGASGQAIVLIRGDHARVIIFARGVSPNLPHAQHIHIGGQNVCPPPSAAATNPPTDLIDVAEGAPFYGGIRVSLTTEGDVSPGSGLAVDRFPVGNRFGFYIYHRSFTLPEGTTAEDVKDGHIVVHGISKLFDDPNQYDGAPRSSIAPSLPLEVTIPALCGELD